MRELTDSRTKTTTSTRFSHRTTLSACKRGSFWREKRDTVVILARCFAKTVDVTKQVQSGLAVGIFLSSRKAQLPDMRITEQPILLTKNKINRSGCKFSTYFR